MTKSEFVPRPHLRQMYGLLILFCGTVIHTCTKFQGRQQAFLPGTQKNHLKGLLLFHIPYFLYL